MKPLIPNKRRRCAAFTMVELAMTALLLTVGVLAVFALMRRGVMSRAELDAEVRGAAFAETAFNTLRLVSDMHLQYSTPSNDYWTAFWTDFSLGRTNLALLGDSAWQSQDSATSDVDGGDNDGSEGSGGRLTDFETLRFFGDDAIRTNRWFLLGNKASDTNNWPDAVNLYQCTVDFDRSVYQGGYLSADPTNIVKVTLQVWPNANRAGRPRSFFTLFSNTGRLP